MAGSEKRQRDAQIKIRCTSDEFTAVAAKADKAGMSLAGFARAALLGTAGPRSRRRLPVDGTALRQVLGHLGKIGSNLNQIARYLNTGGAPAAVLPDLEAALIENARLRDMLYEALGKAPDHAPPAIPSKFIPPPST
jgi:hypothetical protein